MKKIIAIIMAAVLMTVSFASCGGVKTPDKQETFDVTTKEKVNVQLLLDDGRIMEFELYPKIAPITVQNFVDLATSGFYDGLTFHRIISGFVVQGGDPNGDGTGGSGTKIKGEFSENGVENTLSHTKGVISMARQSSLTGETANEVDTLMDSATSQFFIVLDNSAKESLDGKYASFGKMTKGFDVLEQLGSVATDSNDKPLEKITINSIRVVD